LQRIHLPNRVLHGRRQMRHGDVGHGLRWCRRPVRGVLGRRELQRRVANMRPAECMQRDHVSDRLLRFEGPMPERYG
jgi:hypothetical protein